MEIPILSCLKHIVLFVVCYITFYQIYKRILHSDYRWDQEGNVCYSNARFFARICGTILFIIIELFINGLIYINLN